VLLAGCSGSSRSSDATLRHDIDQYLAQGQLAEASALADRGLALSPDANSPEHWTYRLLRAEIRLADGQTSDAAAIASEHVASTPAFTAVRARQKYLTGRLLVTTHRLEDAFRVLDEAMGLARAASDNQLALDAGVLRGRAALQLARWDEGAAILTDVVDRARSGGDRSREAFALNTLGMGWLVRSRFDEALPYFERVLATPGIEALIVYSTALNNAGICYARLGEFDRAVTLQRRAIASHEQRTTRVYLEQALGELGSTYILRGDPAKAVPHLERALRVARTAGLQRDSALLAENLAAAYIDLADWANADRVNALARQLNTASGADMPAYYTLNDAQIAAGRGHAEKATTLFSRTLALGRDDPSTQGAALAGLARLAVSAKDRRTAAREFQAALDTIERTRAELLQTDYKLSYLTRLISFYREYVQALVEDGQIDRALEIADSSRARVLEGGFDTPQRRASAAGFRQLARRTGAVLLSYWLGPAGSYAWVVEPAGIHIATLHSSGTLEPLVREHQQLIVDGGGDPLKTPGGASDKLYEALVKPVERWLPAGRPVVIVPDGMLHTLNFETLTVPGADRHYWIEDVDLVVAPSIGVLAEELQSEQTRTDARQVLLVGNPATADPRFPALRFAPAEIAEISGHFPAARVTTIAGATATPSAYLAAGPEHYSIIHFAAHASANRETPLDSSVILSRDGSGYKLYARQVAETPLHADLVTISACRSAGERLYSGEGLIGFAWAFLRAGSRRVIAGLWDVDDRSTVDLMDRLYSGIAAGEPAAVALRAAKVSMIRRGDNYAKPYYWAPFQVFTRSVDRRVSAGVSSTRAEDGTRN
jgi:CHAT domain-containing protein